MSDGMLQFDFMGKVLMPAVDAIFVKIAGKGGHGAPLHRDIEPILVASSVVMNVQTIVSVFVFIGTYGSSLAMAGGEVAEKAGIPVMGTSPTNPLVTLGKKFYFRACFIDPFQGAGAATYAFRELGFRRAAILTDVASDYSVGLSSFFKRAFAKMGGEIAAELKYQSGDQDFTAQLTELISKKPDIVFLPAYFAEGAIVLKQAKELGVVEIRGGKKVFLGLIKPEM